MGRAEWLPVERRRAHPSDAPTAVSAIGCGAALLLPFSLSVFWLPLPLILIVLAGLFAAWVARPRRDARVFAELGPGDEDMVAVRAVLHRGKVLLGTDQGYLWPERGTTSFQGERVAFRVGGPGWKARRRDLGGIELLGPDGERVLFERLERAGAGELPIALRGTGPTTPPPLDRDPAMRPPALAWRVPAALLAIGAWAWVAFPLLTFETTPFLFLWSLPFALLIHFLLAPVFRDRRRRRG